MNYNKCFINKEFPVALSKSELHSYFEKMKNGDTKARDFIVMHNVKLVLNQVNKYFNNTPFEKADLVSVGLIGLIKSVDTFDVSRNVSFSSYACRVINNEILMFLRKNKMQDYSLDKVLYTCNDGEEFRIIDTLYDDNSDFTIDYEKKETNIIIRQLVENLPERDKEIITLYFGFFNDKPLSQRKIASKLGISAAYTSRLIIKVLDRIKKQLKEYGIIESSRDKIIKMRKQ